MTRRARAVVLASVVAVSFAASAASAPPGKASAAPGKAASAAVAAARASAPASAAATPVVEFNGTFAAGTTYVGEMFYDARALKTWRPVKDVQPGHNVAWTVAWSNLDQFPALKTAATQARPQRFRFRVVQSDIVSGSPRLPWMATYRCEVLAVDPVAAPPPQAARRR
jgi:hypothetical protein